MSSEGTEPAELSPPPAEIGPYHIVGVLGEGGMGVVYEALERGAMRRRVAIKVVRAGLSSREIIARFEAERQALALMDHPGIAKVFQAGETERGEPYFAMELVRGLPLTEYCDSRQLTTRQRLTLFVAICQAVQHAHQKGVIHRDLKPSNILVAEQDGLPQPKIIDFGIAKALGQQLTDATLVTSAGMTLGTAAYMSPEQAESPGLDVDTRSDVYSLGVVLYELLVGRVPVEPSIVGIHVFLARLVSRENTVAVPSTRVNAFGPERVAIARARRTHPDDLGSELRGDLDWIVMKALDPDRNRRYDSAAAFAADITRHLSDQPVVARPPSTRYRLQKLLRRHRVAVPATAAALLLLIASAIFATAGMVRATRAEKRAAEEAAAAQHVTAFLVSLFRVNDPGTTRPSEITARELLDRGAQRAALDLAQQPELQGRIMQTMGTAYGALGLYDAARTQLEQAKAAQVRALGPESPAVAETELALGDAAIAKGDFAVADEHLRHALAIRERTLGPSHPDVARVLASIAAMRLKQHRLDAADSLYTRALAIEQAPGGDSAQLARDLMGLAGVRLSEKRYADAEQLMRHTLAIQERRLGPDHPQVASVTNNLGALYWMQGRYADALPLYERTRAIFEHTLDSTHPNVASVLNNLAETHWKLHHYADAEPLFRRALSIKEARLAPENPSIAVTLNGLAGLMRDMGRLSESERYYRRALAIRERAFKSDDPNVGETVQGYAGLLRDMGRAPEADALEARLGWKR
jgi:serine/threonine protein kinase/tetratricopeptide (TPR) repeat protein